MGWGVGGGGERVRRTPLLSTLPGCFKIGVFGTHSKLHDRAESLEILPWTGNNRCSINLVRGSEKADAKIDSDAGSTKESNRW